jgi:DNA-binding response OmpR family regulator
MNTKTRDCDFPLHQEFYDASWCCLTCHSQAEAEIVQETEVLIVTEDFEVSEAIGSILQDQGYQIYLAPDVSTAVAELDNYNFDLLVIQLSHDSQEGLAAVYKAKQGENHTKVMVISEPRGKVFPVAAFELELDDYLIFPFTTAELCRRVAALLGPGLSAFGGLAEQSPAERINARALESLNLLMGEIRSSLVKATASLSQVKARFHGHVDKKGTEQIDEVAEHMAHVIALTQDFHRKSEQHSQFHGR